MQYFVGSFSGNSLPMYFWRNVKGIRMAFNLIPFSNFGDSSLPIQKSKYGIHPL